MDRAGRVRYTMISAPNRRRAVSSSLGALASVFHDIPVVVLGLLVAGVGALNYIWLSYNTLPPHWDTANHMISALKYHDTLSQCVVHSHLTLGGIKYCVGNLIFVDRFVYAPLFPFVGGLVAFVTGRSITGLAMTNVPFLAVLVLSVYLIGRKLHSHLTGLLAALLIVSYPLMFQLSREFMLELSMVAMTAASCCCLILSDCFRKKAATILFGVTLGFGVLTKFTFLTYLVGPGVFMFAHLVTDVVRRRVDPREAIRRLSVLAAALALGLGIASVWYWPHRGDFLNALRFVTSLDTTHASVLAPASLAYYANVMLRTQMGPPLFALFIVGAIRFGADVTAQHRTLLLVWIGSIYAIHTASTFKTEGNDVGILLPAAVITAIGVASLGRGRRLAMTGVTSFIALQLAVLTLPESWLGARVGTFGWTGVTTAFPRTEDWKIESVLQSLSRPARVAVVSDHLFLNGTTVQFYTLKDDLPLNVSPCWKLGSGSANLSGYDVVIAKSDDAWVHPKAEGCFGGDDGPQEYAALIRQLKEGSIGFALNRSIALPDGSSMLVFTPDGARR